MPDQDSAAGRASVAAYQSRLAAKGFGFSRFRDGMHIVITLSGPEPQKRCDVSHVVEFGIIFHIEKLYVMPDDPGQYRFRYVHYLASFASANRTVTYQVCIEVAATGALDRLCDVVFSDQQCLYFTHFQ